jgi:hypothetical protein
MKGECQKKTNNKENKQKRGEVKKDDQSFIMCRFQFPDMCFVFCEYCTGAFSKLIFIYMNVCNYSHVLCVCAYVWKGESNLCSASVGKGDDRTKM